MGESAKERLLIGGFFLVAILALSCVLCLGIFRLAAQLLPEQAIRPCSGDANDSRLLCPKQRNKAQADHAPAPIDLLLSHTKRPRT
jgi:hypothetical protein